MSNAKKLHAVEVIPAAFFAVPSVVPATADVTTWAKSAHRLVSNGMTDAVVGQTRHPRGIPL